MNATNSPLQDNRFLILAEFGRGGTSSVVQAFDRIEQRVVALKTTYAAHPRSAAHPIVREFDRTMRVVHPNVVRHWELRTARKGPLPPDAPYIVMEPIEGRRVDRTLDPDLVTDTTIRGLARAVLDALAHVHAAGLVHRDVKPSNVFLASADRSANAKLADFGHATPMGIRERPGTLHGSVPYLAPESMLGRPIDGRADLYALGLTIYRLVSGHHPHPHTTVESTVRWHLLGADIDPAPLKKKLSPKLVRLVLSLCRRDPDRRPATAECALEDLGGGGTERVALDDSATLRESRTRLRLDLDAARLGARRIHVLPEPSGWSDGLLREARVWADTRDLVYQELRGDTAQEFARVTLHVAAALGRSSLAWIRRERLERFLPITVLGGAALWRYEASCPEGVKAGIDRWVRFLLRCACRRTIVIHVAPGAGDHGRLLRRLRSCASDARAGTGRNGLLVLTERSAPRTGRDIG